MVNTHSQAASQFSLSKLDWNRLVVLFVWMLLLVGAASVVSAQSADDKHPMMANTGASAF